jgi:tetratricopeptide (TPR) repeat protein
MDKQDFISLSQIGLYNPQRVSDEVMEKLFIVRQRVFEFLMEKIRNEAPNSIPQHHLIIAQRGMGKTTLLKRIEVELRKNADYQDFMPLLYPEEQYNLSNLAELWLNSLDAMADTLQVEKQDEIVRQIDQKVRELTNIKNDEALAKQAFQYFQEVAKTIKRRPVLLIDNLNLVFDRLTKADQHILRSLLMQNNAPILIGASAISIEDTYDYKAPFYDAFQMHYLQKLVFEELLAILKQLAILTNATELLPTIQEEIARLKTIHQLTGGNPRTAVMLFKLIVRGFSKEINDDLEALLDEITPLYKARFEELSAQNQKIVDVIALNWDPINLEQLRNESRLENGQLSPQLKRLVEVGWIERTDAYQAKGGAYSISERFFNIWFLMRRSSRRQKREILCLSKFLESFYGENLSYIARNRLGLHAHNLDHITYNLAMAMALKDPELSKQLENKSYKELREFAKTNPEILKQFDVPEEDVNIEKYLEEEKRLLKKIQNYPYNYLSWHNLGALYLFDLKNYIEAKKAFSKAIEIDEEQGNTWHLLGHVHELQNDFEGAEIAYLEALEVVDKDNKTWRCLGNLYFHSLHKYSDAEKAYLKAIEFQEITPNTWNNLGELYQKHLKKYAEAEKAYLNAIKLGENGSSVWNNLGNLYQDYLQKYKESEKAYLEALQTNEDSNVANYNLVFLYRDKLNKINEAQEIFDKILIEKELEDSHWLNKTLFDLYDKNEGLAKESLNKALNCLKNELSYRTQDDWYRFAAVATKLGYGKWLLQMLEEKGFDIMLAPYFVAIKAINESDQEGYLNSKAIEVREPARKIIEIMQRY